MKIARQKNIVIKAAIFLLLVVVILLLAYHGAGPFSILGPVGDKLGEFYTKKDSFAEFMLSLGAYSPLFFILIEALQVLISPIPGELTGMAGGYIYGATRGFIYSTIGLTFGSWAAFALARFFGRPFVQKVVSENVLKKFDFLTTDSGAAVCFLLFLLPGFPKDPLCYLLGLSRMRLGRFFVLSTLARMPGTYLLTLGAASVRNEHYPMATAIAALSVMIIFIAYIYRERFSRWIKSRSGKTMQQRF